MRGKRTGVSGNQGRASEVPTAGRCSWSLFLSILGSPQTLLSTYSVPWEHIGENAKEIGRWNQKQKERPRGCNTAKLSEPADLPKAGDSSFILS